MGASFGNRMPISPDPVQVLQQCNFHGAVVRDVKDPQGRGRVRVECQSLWGKGEECWSYWLETCCFPIGSSYRDGDHGMWWCPVPGERVLVGYVAGMTNGAFCMPGFPWQSEPGNDKALVPLEAKRIHKEKGPRQGTRIRAFKTESGATWFVDDRGKEERMFFVDWTGAGFFSDAPGMIEDFPEKAGEPSIFRNAERRGTRTVFAQTSKKPSQLVQGGVALSGFLDLNGQGLVNIAEDGKGRVVLFATKTNGDPGPSLVLDAEHDLILLTAKDTQLQVDGEKGHIKVTRQLVQEAIKVELSKLFSGIYDRLKSAFTRYHVPDPQDLGQGLPKGEIIST